MRVYVGSTNPVKAEAVRRIFARAFPNEAEGLNVKLVAVDPGVPAQPRDEEVPRGAVARARAALAASRGEADFGVGIEAGLLRCDPLDTYFDVQFCAIVDREGKITVGHGAGFVYPPRVLRAVLQGGRTVGEAMVELSRIPDIGKKMGAIGYLSRGLLDRTQLTEQAVLMALIPRLRPELYELEGANREDFPLKRNPSGKSV